ncbi:hypothetical protein HY642_04900 [Candidatus Woesearchaeota archaeon]|nr:hypothetical protein [Candidatus Woesearchaeota archaeon]
MNPALEYRIGGMKLVPDELRMEETDPLQAAHRFVVEVTGYTASIYVACAPRHKYVAGVFNIREDLVVGGGMIYVNADNSLVLSHFSGKFEGIPCDIAKRFGELIAPELRKQGIGIASVIGATDEKEMSPYWERYGYKRRTKAL